MTKVLIFAEGSFEHVHVSKSIELACEFVVGLSEGAGLYGAGACVGYIWPIDEKDMRKEEDPAEVERALKTLGGE